MTERKSYFITTHESPRRGMTRGTIQESWQMAKEKTQKEQKKDAYRSAKTNSNDAVARIEMET
jgi:hypothetical protein